jgi:hypothetical protein
VTERPSFDLTAEDLDTSFKLPDEGWHTVEIDEAEETESKNGDLQYIVKYKSVDDTFKGKVWDYITVTKKSIQNIMSLSRAIGEDVPTKAKPGPYTPPDADDLVGKELQIEIIHEPDFNKKTDDEGNIIIRSKVRFAGRKRVGEKTGVPDSKKTGVKAPAKAKAAGGFSV